MYEKERMIPERNAAVRGARSSRESRRTDQSSRSAAMTARQAVKICCFWSISDWRVRIISEFCPIYESFEQQVYKSGTLYHNSKVFNNRRPLY